MTQNPLPSITFHGAAGTVTGSRHLLSFGHQRVLVDCGLFQGLKELRLRNWRPLPFPVDSLHAVVLTHAHIDHSGALPRLVKEGYRGPIYCTPATRDLLEVLLPDAAALQEEEAEYANNHRYSRHHPALPLFNQEDVARTLERLEVVPFGESRALAGEGSFEFHRVGHILGAAAARVTLGSGPHSPRVLFSGDVGRVGVPILPDPATAPAAEYLVLEATYGDRLHPQEDPSIALVAAIRQALKRGGVLLLPAFAVGRTQELLYDLRRLMKQEELPEVPVYLDSPMAREATEVYARHREEWDEETRHQSGPSPFHPVTLRVIRSRQESMELNNLRGPAIIIAGSGMASGGRILHHLKHRLSDPRNTVLFVGFQAEGTRGRLLTEGAREIKLLGETLPVLAHVDMVEGFSAHADAAGLLAWAGTMPVPPSLTFVVHGEPPSLVALKKRLEEDLHWAATIPDPDEKVVLTAQREDS